MGEHSIDLAEYGWFPVMLPSDAESLDSSDGSDDDNA